MSGSLRQRSKGSWEIKFEAPADATGARKTIFRTIKGSKRQAEARLVELQSEAARGGLVDYSKETLGEFLLRWLRDWAAHNASPKTRERWVQLIDNQITPRLGGAPMQKIKPAHLTELYGALMREGAVGGKPLAPRTVHHVHRLLHRAFGFAVLWEPIRDNPAARASPPKVTQKEVEIRPKRRSSPCSSGWPGAIRRCTLSPLWRSPPGSAGRIGRAHLADFRRQGRRTQDRAFARDDRRGRAPNVRPKNAKRAADDRHSGFSRRRTRDALEGATGRALKPRPRPNRAR